MNRKLLILGLILGLIAPISLCANATESTVSVDYVANKDMAPDTVKIKFYIENSGINLSDVKQKNDKMVSDAINSIKKKLNDNETIRTIAFRVNNVYSYKDKVRVFQKYEVTNGFEVKLKDLNKISEIIKIAMDSGVKRIDNPVFSLENADKACNELLVGITKTAKQRANEIAIAAGAELLKVKSINPYCTVNSSVSQPRYYNSSLKAVSSMADEAAGAMDIIEAGTINVRANVNMMYYLK